MELINSLWYEDHQQYGPAASEERMRGRIVKVTELVGDDYVKIENVGGTNISKVGRVSTVKRARLGKSYRPYPEGWEIPGASA